jgi:iron complex outermembrane receptor protein
MKTLDLSLLVGVLCLGASSYAAVAEPNAAVPIPASTTTTDDSLQEIVVSGFRESLATAVQDKRTAVAIVDTIAAEDIGKFPEQNLAESLQRITGVQIQRSAGEGQFVSIRGLDPKFTQVDLDGRALPTPTGTRTFDFTIFSSDFVNAVDVYKSPTADLTEGGLAGVANVRTIDPATVKDRQIVFVAKGSDDLNSRDVDPRFTGLYADKLLDGRLGIVLGADYSKRHFENFQYQAFGLQPYTAQPAGPFTVSGLFDNAQTFNLIPGDRERSTYLGSLSFALTDNFKLYGEALYSRFANDDVSVTDAYRQTNLAPPPVGGIISSTPSPSTPSTILTTLDASGIDYRNNGRTNDYKDTLESFALGASLDEGPLSLRLDASTSLAKEVASTLALEAIGRINATSTISGLPAVVTIDPGQNPLNPNLFSALGVNGEYNQPTTDKIEAVKLDGAWHIDNVFVDQVKFGVRYAQEVNTAASQSLNVSAQTLAGLLGTPYNATIEGGSFSSAPYMTQYSANFFGHSITYLSANLGSLLAKVPLSALLASTPLTENLASTYSVKEDSYAGYMRLDFRVPASNLTGNIGFRMVSTKQTSSGYSPNLNDITFDQQGAQTLIPNVTATSVGQSYNNFLPNLNLTYTVAADLLLRFAAAKTMTRSDLSQLAPNTTVNANVKSITAGNPNLTPYTATQFDLSLEWYLNKGGLLSTALFYKDVKNFIQNGSTSTTLNVTQVQGGTIPITFSVLQPENGGTAILRGVEVGYQQAFTFLPAPFDNFGAVLNYTYVDASQLVVTQGSPSVPLSGVSKDTYNLVGFYETPRFGVRVAYNYRSGYVVDPLSYFGDGDFRKSYGQLDLSASYHVLSNFDLTVEALNVTNNALIDVDKYGINRGYETDGTTVLLGGRYRFR